MGRKIVRVGDKNSAGGKVISGDNTVFLNGKPIAVDGSPVTTHTAAPFGKGNHTSSRCRATETSVYVNGKRIIFVGDKDTCGHPRIDGSPDVSST